MNVVHRMLFAVAALCAVPLAHGVQAPSVTIKKFAFVPQEITVAPGTTVTWTNQDETPHTLKAQSGAFTSKALDTDDRFTFTFAEAGDFAYFCTLHPFMTGVVHVRADANAAHAGAGTPP